MHPIPYGQGACPRNSCTVWHLCNSRLRLKCDGTRAEIRFRFSAKRTSPFKSAGGSVQSTAGSRGVRISGSNAGYTVFRGSVKSTGYPLHSPVSPSLSLPCVTVCHHISTGVYYTFLKRRVACMADRIIIENLLAEVWYTIVLTKQTCLVIITVLDVYCHTFLNWTLY